jgi:hypothetical protein
MRFFARSNRSARVRSCRPSNLQFRPRLEGLESRVVLSTTSLLSGSTAISAIRPNSSDSTQYQVSVGSVDPLQIG